ncbi:hypothetical protein LXA43DRAFT_895017, partial [Ganoderma leucocontextum]
VTNDNASNNATAAAETEARLRRRGVVGDFVAKKNTLGCFGHVVQLAIEDFMGEIMQVAVAENKQAIWNYDPNDPPSSQ